MNDTTTPQTTTTGGSTADDRYVAPGRFTRRVFNPLVGLLTRAGISISGSRVLTVVGRTSGEPRSVPVNVLSHDGDRYLVAPRGNTEWVRNLRAAQGRATIRSGRRTEEIRTTEVDDADKVPVLRSYLDRWGWEVGQFFENLDASSTDEDLASAAPGFPVFRIH